MKRFPVAFLGFGGRRRGERRTTSFAFAASSRSGSVALRHEWPRRRLYVAVGVCYRAVGDDRDYRRNASCRPRITSGDTGRFDKPAAQELLVRAGATLANSCLSWRPDVCLWRGNPCAARGDDATGFCSKYRRHASPWKRNVDIARGLPGVHGNLGLWLDTAFPSRRLKSAVH